MQRQAEATGESTWLSTAFVNPVFAESFPDPFVLKYRGEYFAYCTGFAQDDNVFGVLHSHDLVSWWKLGGAMKPLEPSPPYYWAPEVSYDNGKFYLYYSVGNETFMELRVAVSDNPAAGFVDSGHRLTTEDFAIDAHVFIDDDRSRYLFYATDFLQHTHIGTGTVVDRMLDWFTLEGNPRPVTRAKYGWQIYDPAREEKGGVCWHTVEGPAVIKRKNKYFEMFSGGNWKNTTYGVSFAVTDDIHVDDEWSQFSDGEKVLPILRTIPDRIVGPGHNSVVRGPNGRELYCIYHRWTENGRVMAIDRIDFAGDRIFIVGATDTPQPAPFLPSISDRWKDVKKRGEWKLIGSELTSDADGRCELVFESPPESFLSEFTFCCMESARPDGLLALSFTSGNGKLELTLHPTSNVARLNVPDDSPGLPSIFKLPEDIDWTAPHTLRLEVDHRRLNISIGSATLNIKTYLANGLQDLKIGVEHLSVAFTSFALTEGFEDLFCDDLPLEGNGWSVSGSGTNRVNCREVLFESDGEYVVTKGGSYESCEIAANFRLVEERNDARYGLILKGADSELRVMLDASSSAIRVGSGPKVDLGDDVDFSAYHQLRALKISGQVLCYFDEIFLGEFRMPASAVSGFVFCERAKVGVEMIRLTRV